MSGIAHVVHAYGSRMRAVATSALTADEHHDRVATPLPVLTPSVSSTGAIVPSVIQ